METTHETTIAERTETDPAVQGIRVRTQRTLADSMQVECPEHAPDGGVPLCKVEEDTMLVNPDVNSMESRG